MVKCWKLYIWYREWDKDAYFSPLLFNDVPEVLAIAIRWEKDVKELEKKKEAKLLLLSDDDWDIEIPKYFRDNLLALVSKLSEVLEYGYQY